MITAREFLIEGYNTFTKEEIANEMVRAYDLSGPLPNLIHNLGVFESTVKTIANNVVNDHTLIVTLTSIEDSEETYFLHTEIDGDNNPYSTSYIPFDRILNYKVEEGLKMNLLLVTSLIWELTFDGFTAEEQSEKIEKFTEIINREL